MVKIADLPDLGAVTDSSKVVGHRVGSGTFLGSALKTYAQVAAAEAVEVYIDQHIEALPPSSPFAGDTYKLAGVATDPALFSGTDVRAYVTNAINVMDKGAVGNGIADCSAAFQTAVSQTAASGGIISVPAGTWLLNTDVTNPDGKPIMWQINPGAHFTGAGRMPPLRTNILHNATALSLSTTPALADAALGRGYSTVAAEVVPGATFVGEAVGGYFGARLAAGSGYALGTKTAAELLAAASGTGYALQADLHNYSVAGRGRGVNVTGVGDATTECGVDILRGNTASRWLYGLRVRFAQVGIAVDLSDVGSDAAVGLYVKGLPKNHIKLQPSNDSNPGDAVAYVANAADNVVNFQVTKRGGVMIGPGGTEVLKHLSATALLNLPSIAAQSDYDADIPLPGVVVGDSVTASPQGVVQPGCVWCAYAATDGVKIRVANVSASALDPDGGGGLIWRVDCWKH